ncbi:fibronectin type III domain-containing protein [Actinoplanes sp. SE50]|uniref:Ig-like domain-containing protein n=1 Tax=unclassified Actinoplanes TaxID=2626549 RepID=UPI00023ED30D|nr:MULTISPECIES: Ig-like domain-containing protein [unclassified Actinoplanes]AEV87823.1 fibronectin type III domain protein [Actinoplanes sp. SE50/110]ATO86225.1 fibronectin type III domain-containing protein [Actinoplanes sp. SE50]SLM03640.1 fibronectin type III domain-containing protein [Actinoplanes sp. SE50/110]
MARLRKGTIAVVIGSLSLTATTPAHADEPVPDTTPPVITSTGLTPGQLVGAYKGFKPIVSDNSGTTQMQVLLNGKLSMTMPVNWDGPIRLNAKALPTDTDLDVTLRVKDPAGNTTDATTRVHLDSSLPTATPSPAYGTAMESGPVTITLTDVPDDVTKIAMHFYSTGQDVIRTEGPWTFQWDASEQSEIPYFILTDRAGNTNNVITGYIVDNDPPVIEHLSNYIPQITLKPGTTTTIGAYATLTAVVNDKSRLSRTEWWVNGVLRATNPDEFRLTPDMTTGTTATIELRVWDGAGHPASAIFPLAIDRVGPSISNITPDAMALVRGTSFTTTVVASDPNGVADFTVYSGSDAASGNSQQQVPTGRDGRLTYTWQATDRFGNETSASRTVVVDNTKPALAFGAAPANGAKLTKTATITATASDHNRIAKVQMLVNGKIVATDTTPGYRFVLNPAKYGRTFTVQLRAYDKAGNVSHSSTRTYHR